MSRTGQTTLRHPPSLLNVWLTVGLILLLFANGQWIVPVATWLSPVFVMRFTRAQTNRWGLAVGAFAYVAVFIVAWDGMIQLAPPLSYAVAGAIGAVFLLPYLADRLLAPRLPGFAATLAFPLAYTTLEYVGFQFTPYGTWGSLAYTQFGNLPLMQIASITGIYGVTLLITWFAAVTNWAWEQGFDWPTIRTGAKIYAGVLVAVLLFGGANLVLFYPAASQVKVAGVQSHIAKAALERVNERFSAGDFSAPVWAAYFAQAKIVIDDLFAKSEVVAKGGAKIVSWAENPVMIPKDDEAAFIDRGKRLAQQERIYLALNYSINLGTDPSRAPAEKIWSAKVVIVGPAGDVLSTYRKTILVPGFEATVAVSGNDDAGVVDTPYGRILALICYDNDFPSFVRKQVAGKSVDILLDPSGDWEKIDPYHTNMMAFRAIENGFSVVRVTGFGLSAVYDYQGRTLATMDYFKTDDKVFTAYVPTKGMTTVYATVGDVFAWLCVVGAVAVAGLVALRRTGKTGSPGVPT